MRPTRALVSLSLVLALGCGGEPPTGSATEPDSAAAAATTAGAESPDARRDRADVVLLGESRVPSADEAQVVDRIVQMTARVRELPLRRPLDVRVAANDAIARHLIAGLEDEEIVELRDLYVSIGMLAPSDDVTAILGRVVGEQVVGFYDPELDLLVIRSDVMQGLASGREMSPETFITIAHEVVHALQGQHLDLRARMDREDIDTDDSDAYQALVEGDATLGMLAVAASVSRQPLAAILAASPTELDFAEGQTAAGSAELAGAPPIIRIGLTAPYIAGLGFCAALHERAEFAGVDGAHRRLPSSMEQLLHPEKYFADEREETIDLGPLEEVLAAGYTQVREDTLGELEIGIYLARGSRRDLDTSAAAGWAGDRVRVYRRGDTLAAAFVMRFDTETDAREAEEAARRADSPTEARATVRKGRDLVVVHGFEPALRETIRTRLAGATPSQ